MVDETAAGPTEAQAIRARLLLRVRGRTFAERPRVLFGFDPLGLTNLDPL